MVATETEACTVSKQTVRILRDCFLVGYIIECWSVRRCAPSHCLWQRKSMVSEELIFAVNSKLLPAVVHLTFNEVCSPSEGFEITQKY